MTHRRSPYRIELVHDAGRPGAPVRRDADAHAPADADPRIGEVVAMLHELRAFIDPSQRMASDVIEAYRREIAEVYRLRSDLEQMKAAIDGTRVEIAAIRRSENEGRSMRRVNDELDAVVADTEQATTSILNATEDIEAEVSALRASADSDAQIKRLNAIVSRTAALYEACNFQDLTGQRITKIVGALHFIEQRLNRVIEVWGQVDGLSHVATLEQPQAAPEASLINGPKLPGADGHVSQDEIDHLFD